MKIAVLTLPLHINYGGILQAYALQTVLEQLGHSVDVIEFHNTSDCSNNIIRNYKDQILSLFKNLIKRYLLHRKVYIFYEREKKRLIPITHQHTNRFIEQYIHLKKYDSLTELNDKCYEVYVVGSDQVWRPLYSPNLLHAYLDFTVDWTVKRIAYAPSFGADTWEYTVEQTEACKNLIVNFDAVSVREDCGVKLCEEYLNCKSVQLLDPTLLLSKDIYDSLIDSYEMPPLGGNLFNYILDETQVTKEILSFLANNYNLSPFKVNVWEPYAKVEVPDIVPLEDRIQKPVELWLKSIRDSRFVVTDSFHACVFSIIFRKPFMVVQNLMRGNGRIGSLLRLIGEEFRIISSVEQIKDYNVQLFQIPAIEKLSAKKEESLQFLIKSIT